jgi:hypothetical protein
VEWGSCGPRFSGILALMEARRQYAPGMAQRLRYVDAAGLDVLSRLRAGSPRRSSEHRSGTRAGLQPAAGASNASGRGFLPRSRRGSPRVVVKISASRDTCPRSAARLWCVRCRACPLTSGKCGIPVTNAVRRTYQYRLDDEGCSKNVKVSAEYIATKVRTLRKEVGQTAYALSGSRSANPYLSG